MWRGMRWRESNGDGGGRIAVRWENRLKRRRRRPWEEEEAERKRDGGGDGGEENGRDFIYLLSFFTEEFLVERESVVWNGFGCFLVFSLQMSGS